MEVIKFPIVETVVDDVCDAAKENSFVFIIGELHGEYNFYSNEDMSTDEIVGFLERMKMEVMRTL